MGGYNTSLSMWGVDEGEIQDVHPAVRVPSHVHCCTRLVLCLFLLHVLFLFPGSHQPPPGTCASHVLQGFLFIFPLLSLASSSAVPGLG